MLTDPLPHFPRQTEPLIGRAMGDATKRAFGEARIRELRQTAAAALGSEAAADAHGGWSGPSLPMGGMKPRTYAMARSDCLALAKPLLAALKTRREGPPVQLGAQATAALGQVRAQLLRRLKLKRRGYRSCRLHDCLRGRDWPAAC
jgi:hypothetical protein